MKFRFPGTFYYYFYWLSPAACKKKRRSPGKPIFRVKYLVDVLVDIHLVDGITNDRKFHRR